MSSKQYVRMSDARLERVQLLRKQISDAAFELRALSNDAGDLIRRDALYGAALHAAHAALDLQAIVERDAALPERPQCNHYESADRNDWHADRCESDVVRGERYCEPHAVLREKI